MIAPLDTIAAPAPSALASARGASLVEMMVSLAVLAITLASFQSATRAAQGLFYHEKLVTVAIAVGESVTEGLLLLDSSDPLLELGTHEESFSAAGRPTDDVEARYTARWVVSNFQAVPGIRQITIEVEWEEAGVAKEVRWITYRS